MDYESRSLTERTYCIEDAKERRPSAVMNRPGGGPGSGGQTPNPADPGVPLNAFAAAFPGQSQQVRVLFPEIVLQEV